MKSLLKFSLLSALIISGKLAKQSAPATVAQTAVSPVSSNNSVVLVHQVISAQSAKPAQEQAPPRQRNSGILANIF
jgi:hypothetical protein